MIVTNCPAREDIVNYEMDNNTGKFIMTGVDTYNYCVKHKIRCNLVADCIVKQVMEGNGKFEVEND